MAEISVIVPVYKVEKFLERCVESLISQTYKDIEIILVDDGSPDQCPIICDRLAETDTRIRVIHKKNGGLSSARNAGMDIATGHYIGFVDSDDVVSKYMYQKMHEVAVREKVDFVMADYIRVLSDGTEYLKKLDIPEGLYNKKEIKEQIYPQLIMGSNIDYGPILSVWHCLYDLGFLRKNKIRFDEEVRWSEDNIFSAIVGYYASRFYYMKGEGFYRYYQNSGTITTSYREGAWGVYKTMNHHLRTFFADKTETDFSNQLNLHLIYYACNCLGQTALLPRKKCRQQMKLILKDKELAKAFEEVQFGSINIRLKIQLLLMKYKRICALEYLVNNR